ncbi:DEAD/DEAH box helicase family protein [Geminocystis sp.]|uniref:restriction endonuclease n=1 Tax=Geminocystis sp. TaxID=2664100 RepID=UPI0035945403
MAKLTFKFDPNQEYQLRSIDSVVNLFQDLPNLEDYQNNYGIAEYLQGKLSDTSTSKAFDEEIVPNLPPDEVIYDELLFENLIAIQEENNLEESRSLEVDEGMMLEGISYDSWRSPSFTVEMETGTGKTYVYLRTIYELSKRYGFRKFIIIVPSTAIYEGVKKSFQIMYKHFASLYDNPVVNLTAYNSSQINRVKNFATSNFVEIMVMTNDSFNKVNNNNLYKPSEKLSGELLPYQYIQQTKPILILDEPQSIDSTEKAKEAIRTLNPLLTLRYSATHRIKPNLVYRLTPVDAYQQNLVKKIEVIGVEEAENRNKPVLILESVSSNPICAKVKTLIDEKGTANEGIIELKQGDDLFKKTKREEYKEGFIVTEISIAKGNEFIEFDNGLILKLKEDLDPSSPEIFRYQIRETIKEHIKKQSQLLPLGIKVLSLFFIDRVANYTTDKGLIKTIFDEEFDRLKQTSPHFQKYSAEGVREGYFAKKKSKTGMEEAIDLEENKSLKKDDAEAQKEAFNLIMKDKERLLSFSESVSFIFAHSTLKEGWDNPNVFQICTLNQTRSEIKKRQEIGRGLRLCVNQEGDRIQDENINILTVIANDSYEKYAETLQKEYEQAGEKAPPKPTNAKRSEAKRRNHLFESQEFKSFWDKLCQKTNYHFNIDSDQLVADCIKKLDSAQYPEPQIVLSRGKFVITEYEIALVSVKNDKAEIHVKIRSTSPEPQGKILDDQHTILDQTITVEKNTRANSHWNKIIENHSPLRELKKIVEIRDKGEDSLIILGEKAQSEINLDQPLTFTSEKGQVHDSNTVQTLNDNYPVFNLIHRASQQTYLTRHTLNLIFAGLKEEVKQKVFKNPEGFTSIFINTIKATVRQHIIDNIEFSIDQSVSDYDVEEIFPEITTFPQREIIEAGENGLYDKVQKDSDVEERFVSNRLRDQKEQVFLYFKFPPKFKIRLPKILGNYNPDWGIISRDEQGKHTLQLVRETKGRTDIENLQYAQEALKIKCAEKHFQAIGIDYRVIDGTENNWWQPQEQQNYQSSLTNLELS